MNLKETLKNMEENDLVVYRFLEANNNLQFKEEKKELDVWEELDKVALDHMKEINKLGSYIKNVEGGKE